jgi:hypothetical protein
MAKIRLEWKLFTGQATEEEKRQAGTDPAAIPKGAGAAQSAGRDDDLRRLFGDHAVREISVNDPRFASELLPGANLDTDFGSEWPSGSSQLLGVECGRVGSRHLAAVLFRKSEAFAGFLRDNPGLRDCLITSWPSVVILWLRIEGHAPRNFNAGPLTWFSEGLVPLAGRERPWEKSLVQRGPIPVVRFGAIEWNARTKDGFAADEIAELFGDPFLPKEKRKTVFNELYCAQMILQKFKVVYDSGEGGFRRFDPATGNWVCLSRERMTRVVTNALVLFSRDFPRQFPPSEIRRSRVRRVIWLIETRSAVDLPTAKEAVEQFFVEAVESCPMAKLTSGQLFEGYLTYCRARRLPLCSRAYFDRRATKRFGRTSHCFGQDGTERGRGGWRLKPGVLEPSLQAA